MLEIGASFDRFIIEAHLAAGGMAKVYRARQVVPAWDSSLREPDRAEAERRVRELEERLRKLERSRE